MVLLLLPGGRSDSSLRVFRLHLCRTSVVFILCIFYGDKAARACLGFHVANLPTIDDLKWESQRES